MTRIQSVLEGLRAQPRTWLVTGCAGFIGSNILERLLEAGQSVVGLDNLETGNNRNLEEVRAAVGDLAWARFRFINDDLKNPAACAEACRKVDYILHQAALGSVPKSIAHPLDFNSTNVGGTLNLLVAARAAGARRFVFASSSSVYGDHPALPKTEANIGNCLSPYAVTKRVNELYADVFARAYGLEYVGLRYFNVFGPRQNPHGPYAAVIPLWIESLLGGKSIYINGDGSISRDFCFVANVVQANILAATVEAPAAINQVYNIAMNGATTLNELFRELRYRIAQFRPEVAGQEPQYRAFRAGDVLHSNADVSKASSLLGYHPTHTVADGLDQTARWYAARTNSPAPAGCRNSG